jgi:hypothetical protein
MGNTFGPKDFEQFSTRVSRSVSRSRIHKADQPNVVVDFFDADSLSGKDLAELIFLLPRQIRRNGDHDGLVVEG